MAITTSDGYTADLVASAENTIAYLEGTLSYGGTVVAHIYINDDGSGYYTLTSESDAVKHDRAVLKRSQPGQRVAYRFRLCEHLPDSVELAINSQAPYSGSYNKTGSP